MWQLALLGSQDSFLNNIKKFLTATIEEAPKKVSTNTVKTAVQDQQNKMVIGNCPICKKGQVIDKTTFYGCSNYKNGCSFTISKTISKKKLNEKVIKDLLEKGETTKLKGFKSKAGKTFEARLILKNDGIKFLFN